MAAVSTKPVPFEFNFERLETWKKALGLADLVYKLTRAFPDDERFGLVSQMRRATVSVASNLAEGSSRTSRVDFARFVEIATGSIFELVAQAEIAKRQGYLPADSLAELRTQAAELTRMLSGLRRSLHTRAVSK
ncbi:MAG: four helix bundle protein [Verrucomicrobia bacterium]|nr:four helix bundle protein [Verrucomicrobiota bacterium]